MEVLGAVAGAVQLADVALRVSREAYGFLTAIKDSNNDIKALRDALREVEANVRNLRNFVSKFKMSKNAVEEFEVLSEAITNCFCGFHDDICDLMSVLPKKPSPTLARKIKWVYDQHKVKNITKRLNDRKTNLNNALSITGRLHDLRLREDTTSIEEQQMRSNAVLSGLSGALHDHAREHQDGHQQLLQHAHKTNASIDTVRTDIQRKHAELLQNTRLTGDSLNAMQTYARGYHEATAAAIKQQFESTYRHINTLENQNSLLLERTQRSHDTFNSIGSQLKSESQHAHLSLRNIENDLKGLRSTAIFSASDIDMATKILANELLSSIVPIVEQAVVYSNMQNKTVPTKLKGSIYQIASDVGRSTIAKKCDNRSEQQEEKNVVVTSGLIEDNRCQYSRMVSIYHRVWCYNWSIGHLTVEVTHTNRRWNGSPSASSTVTICTHFWPNQALAQLPGISFLFDTGPNRQGFYHFAPMITTFPIISCDHPVIRVVYDGDLTKLQEMLAKGEANLRCQDEDGETLLHYAALYAEPKICSFLVSYGLSWTQPDNTGFTPAHLAWQCAFWAKPAPVVDCVATLELVGFDFAGEYRVCQFLARGHSIHIAV
ncbi:hypothetical protein P153DRAFT_433893 [Dothidotthia symphoricarpi CBS 119687]|uniref:Uncharacterized protein n=1 Tax=Dothidotthia symphoricarpi CBS 119687 TaxID=1392245 RepID=A0A6A6A3G7_9PLEO|nr:uncharacterized protein P153DRAFT_433893 [Dothidotthia symphoricarpi CBS 119687]KAF2126096.1 hypothetical protein P153DRAFT_433893 [Dothidotthia symphoricarpi CBS 119687]